MTEISLLRSGDDKLRVIHTTDSVGIVSERIANSLKSGVAFYADYPTGHGMIFIPVELLRTCVVTVREAEQLSTAKVQ